MVMARNRLKQLVLTHFRGATGTVSIEFDPSKRITMIFGENGTGKSSIADAFSFVCEENLGSLEDRSGVDKACVASINRTSNVLRVKLITEAGTWEARLKGKATPEVSPQEGRPSVRILRRSKILTFIDAQPKERFKALEDYIDVSQVQKCEGALREAERQAQDDYNQAVSAFTDAKISLTKLWQDSGSPGKEAVNWAEEEISKDISHLKMLLAGIEEISKLLRDAENELSVLSSAREKVISAKQAVKEAEGVQLNEERKLVGQSSDLLQLLQLAKAYVDAASDLNRCPVCQQTVDARLLGTELQSRIAGMNCLADAIKNTENKRKGLETAKSQLQDAETRMAKALEALAKEAAASSLEPIKQKASLTVLIAKIINESLSLEDRIDTAKALIVSIHSILPELEQFKDSAGKTIHLQQTIQTQFKQFQVCKQKMYEAEALAKQLTEARNVVEETRKRFVTRVLQEISQEVERLYSKLHPAEGVGGIRLTLDEQYIGSLHLHGNFYTAENIAPQSVFSESHLDTLGLCVFLALAKRDASEDTIIILDDILTSVDANHLDRFIDLLHEEVEHFNHIIVTTHYRPWQERYRFHRAPGGQVYFIELRSWDLATGISVHKTKLYLDELRQALTPEQFDRQVVASKAGIFLENILSFVARTYGCSVRLNVHGSPTLRDLADSLPRKLVKVLRVERDETVSDPDGTVRIEIKNIFLEPLVIRIKGLSILRNYVGAHFTLQGAEVTDKEIEELGQATVALGEVLICSEGGDLPNRDKTGECWQSRSGKVRLYPHGMPS